jgi:hypothetical protein
LSLDVLIALAESAPDFVSFAALAEQAWRSRFVAKGTVVQRIRFLRRGLGDTGTNSRYLESVRGRGYRLKVAVCRERSSYAASGSRPCHVEPTHGRVSVANITWSGSAAREWYTRAEEAFRRQIPEQAFVYIDRALALEPDFPLALALKAVGLVRSLVNGDSSAPITTLHRTHIEISALRLAERALQLDPRTTLAWIARAMLDTTRWRWARAADAYASARECGIEHPTALEPLAVFYVFRQRPDAALRVAEDMQVLDSTNPMAFWIEGKALSELGRHDEAAHAYRNACRLSPTQVLLQRCIGDAELRLGHRREAESAYRAAERLLNGHPSRSVWLPSLAYGYAVLELENDAARLASEYQMLACPNSGAGDRGLAALASGDEHGAIAALQVALANAAARIPDGGLWPLIEVRSNYLGDRRLREPRFRALRARLLDTTQR